MRHSGHRGRVHEGRRNGGVLEFAEFNATVMEVMPGTATELSPGSTATPWRTLVQANATLGHGLYAVVRFGKRSARTAGVSRRQRHVRNLEFEALATLPWHASPVERVDGILFSRVSE